MQWSTKPSANSSEYSMTAQDLCPSCFRQVIDAGDATSLETFLSLVVTVVGVGRDGVVVTVVAPSSG